ncbi:MAG: galactose-1-phosphate uridylyltransferase [Elusimicrobiales bacterium]
MKPHLRKDVFSSAWVILSDERGRRPNDYLNPDTRCPFCYGNESDTPPSVFERKKDGKWYIRVVRNKYPALVDVRRDSLIKEEIFRKHFFSGVHEIIIETPEHDKKIHEIEHLDEILEVFAGRMRKLYSKKGIKYVMLFRNYGKNAGATLRHPHSQIIALPLVPTRILEEKKSFLEYYDRKKRCLMCDVIESEIKIKKRVFYINDSFIAFAPFASRFNFEIWISPLKHIPDYYNEKNFDLLCDVIRKVFSALHNSIAEVSYNIIFHTSPHNFRDFHWHMEILPKLAMPAGFEWGSGFYINSISPEKAVSILVSGKKFI